MKLSDAITLRRLKQKGFDAYITPNGNLKGSRIGVIKVQVELGIQLRFLKR